MNSISWDKYYLSMVSAVARKSHCMSRQIGAVLVKDNVIISTGYNGPPRKVPHCDVRLRWDRALQARFKKARMTPPDRLIKLHQCPRRELGYFSSEALELCPAVHAEANCIVQAARLGISTKNTTLYVDCEIPCKDCLGLIINAGIIEVVCKSLKNYDELSSFITQSAGLKIRTYDLSE